MSGSHTRSFSLHRWLNGKITNYENLTITAGTNVTLSNASVKKVGKLVYVYFDFALSAALATWSVIATLSTNVHTAIIPIYGTSAKPTNRCSFVTTNKIEVGGGTGSLAAGDYSFSAVLFES